MAEYKGLTIKFKGDDTDLSAVLARISRESKQAQGNLTGIDKAMKNVATNGKELNQTLVQLKIRELGTQAQLASDRFHALEAGLPKLNAQFAKTSTDLNSARVALASFSEEDKRAGESLKSLNRDIQEQQAAISKAKADMEGAAEGTKAYVAAQERLAAASERVSKAEAERDAVWERGTAYNTAASKVDTLKAKHDSLKDSIDRTNTQIPIAESHMKAYAAAAQMASESLEASKTSLGDMGARLTEAGEGLDAIGDKITSVGDRMSLISGVVAVTFGRNIVNSTQEFGNVVSQIGGYLNIEGEQLDTMSQLALQYGKDTKYSATEAGEAIRELAKGGMSEAEIAAGTLNSAMLLASAGNLDMATSANVAVQAVKTFGLDASESARVADAFAGAANKSTAEVYDLAQGLTQVGGTANLANWDINEVTGALALLADRGFTGSAAGTTLKTTLQRLAAPTKKAQEVLNRLGIEVYDASGQMRDAVDVVSQFDEKLKDLTDEQRNQALFDIFGQRGINGITALLDAGTDKFSEYIESTKQTGYAAEMAQAQLGELGWAIELARGEAETAAVNFGEAITPSLISLANAAESAFNWFNSLSDSERKQIADLALLVVGAGPAISVFGHLTKGAASFFTTIGTGASTISLFTKLMKSGGNVLENFAMALAETTIKEQDAVKKAEMVAASTSKMMSAFEGIAVGVGITAAVAALTLMATQIADAIKHENELKEATTGLSESVSNMESVFESARSGAQGLSDAVTMSASEIESTSKSALDAQSELSKSVTTTMDEMGKNTGLIELYASQIEELSSKSSLASGEQEKLTSAVTEFNKIAGTSVSVIDAQTGAINTSIESIYAAVDAYKEYARTQAIMSSYTKIQEQLVENEIEQAKYSKILADGYQEMSAAQALAAGATFEQIDAAAAASRGMKEAEERQTSLKDSLKLLEEMMSDTNMTTDGYKAVLEGLGIAAKDVGSDFGDMANSIDGSLDDAGNAIKDFAEDAETALKRSQEAIYTSAKRAYEDNYRELERALDANYKAYESQLKAAEDELDRYHDEQLEQIKAQNDQILKEAKRANEQETKQFEQETDRRIKAAQSEYEERLKLLEADYGTDSIDKQIKALEDQTKAEKAEQKRQQQNEKQAELEKAVEQAKTRRKKADAEKALNEYLVELEQERREDEREAEIERLKEQKELRKSELADKKEALKSEYDQRIESIKNSRAAELDMLKQSQEDEYDQLKANLDKQYDARKDEYDRELEYMRSYHQSLLEAQKINNEDILLERKRAHEDELTALKQRQEDELTALKAGAEEQKRISEEANDAIVDDAKATTSEIIADLDNRIAQSVTKLDEAAVRYKYGASKIGKNFLTEVSAVKQPVNTVVDDIHNYANDRLAELIKEWPHTAELAGNGLVAYISKAKYSVVGESKGVHDAAMNPLLPLPSEMGFIANDGSNKFAEGIGSAQQYVNSNANNLMEMVRGPFAQMQSDSKVYGSNAAIEYANGMIESSRYVQDAASAIAAGAAAYLHHSTPDKGPLHGDDTWGGEMILNYIMGMRSKEPMLVAESRRAAELVAREFESAYQYEYNIKRENTRASLVAKRGTNEALRNGANNQGGVTIIMNGVTVREEADVERVGHKLYDYMAAAKRRGL